MQELKDLPNVGKVLEAALRTCGIDTVDHFKSLGSREVFLRIRRQVDPGACLSMLYGIQGAIDGVRGHALPKDVKADLKQFFYSL